MATITIFGASGRIGTAVAREAADRGHVVVAAQRRIPDPRPTQHPDITYFRAFIDDPASVAAAVSGSDVVINAVSGLGHENPRISVDCLEPLIEGMLASGVRRLIQIGTAGTLHVAPGIMRMDSDDFPQVLSHEAQAHKELQVKLRSLAPDLISWTYCSPPALIDAGERTGSVILGLDDLLFNSRGESFISNEDYAMVLIDELEQPRFHRTRFTAVSR
jgi:putative NADH-flavin reductase